MKYYTAINTGKGFITHKDNEYSPISGYPGDVYVTENSVWATRVEAEEKTKEEAQSIVDTEVSSSNASLQDYINSLDGIDDERKETLQAELETSVSNPIVLP